MKNLKKYNVSELSIIETVHLNGGGDSFFYSVGQSVARGLCRAKEFMSDLAASAYPNYYWTQ